LQKLVSYVCLAAAANVCHKLSVIAGNPTCGILEIEN
jgi:hypothetical protein